MIDALGADSNGTAAASAAGGDSARSSRRGSHRRHEKPPDPLMSMDTLTLRHVAAAVGHLAQLPEAQHRLAEAGAVAKLVRLAILTHTTHRFPVPVCASRDAVHAPTKF